MSGLILADFNHNGLLNFAITYANYEDCPTSRLIVLEITADGFKDISPPLEEQRTYVHNSYTLLPADDTQTFVIRSAPEHPIKGYPDDCESLDFYATFSWDGERYSRIDHSPIPLHGSAIPDDYVITSTAVSE